jgi:hypothetical protein
MRYFLRSAPTVWRPFQIVLGALWSADRQSGDTRSGLRSISAVIPVSDFGATTTHAGRFGGPHRVLAIRPRGQSGHMMARAS